MRIVIRFAQLNIINWMVGGFGYPEGHDLHTSG